MQLGLRTPYTSRSSLGQSLCLPIRIITVVAVGEVIASEAESGLRG